MALDSTDYLQIVSFIRTLTFDNDSDAYRNSSSTIKFHVQMAMPIVSFSVGFDSVNSVFTKSLSEAEKLEIACQCALNIFIGFPEDFSYKTPVMSARRKFNVRGMIARLEEMLKNILGGNLAVSAYDEIQKIADDAELFAATQ
jgi:hypothetical protein